MGVLLFKLLSVSSYVYSHVPFRLGPLLNRGNISSKLLPAQPVSATPIDEVAGVQPQTNESYEEWRVKTGDGPSRYHYLEIQTCVY
jgi:hypothetical protein